MSFECIGCKNYVAGVDTGEPQYCSDDCEATTREVVALRKRLAAAEGRVAELEARAVRAERAAAFTALCLEHQSVAGSEHREACDEYIAAHYEALKGLERYSEESARLREALESIEDGHPCDEEHREMARTALAGAAKEEG